MKRRRYFLPLLIAFHSAKIFTAGSFAVFFSPEEWGGRLFRPDGIYTQIKKLIRDLFSTTVYFRRI